MIWASPEGKLLIAPVSSLRISSRPLCHDIQHDHLGIIRIVAHQGFQVIFDEGIEMVFDDRLGWMGTHDIEVFSRFGFLNKG